MPSSGSYIRQSEASVNEKVKERRSGWGRQAKFFSGAGRTLLDGVIPAGRRRRPGGQSVRRGIPLRGGRRRRIRLTLNGNQPPTPIANRRWIHRRSPGDG